MGCRYQIEVSFKYKTNIVRTVASFFLSVEVISIGPDGNRSAASNHSALTFEGKVVWGLESLHGRMPLHRVGMYVAIYASSK